jgi:L-fuconolactonase
VIIDAHHHLWQFDPVAYDWIGPADLPLRRDFVLPELTAMATESGLAGTIAVQARQSLEETTWLLDLARQQPLIRGVVGWVPLIADDLPAILDALPTGPLVGVRHVVQGEADPGFLQRPLIERGLREIARRGLTYDILIKAHQLPQAIACVERFPGLRFVLDHGGKPDIRKAGLATWQAGLRTLARYPNVACKLSGLVTEADPATWNAAQLTPYATIILEAFGPQRVLFGSDWPVCLLGTSHRHWLATVRDWIDHLSPTEQAAILGDNAVTWYRLETP